MLQVFARYFNNCLLFPKKTIELDLKPQIYLLWTLLAFQWIASDSPTIHTLISPTQSYLSFTYFIIPSVHLQFVHTLGSPTTSYPRFTYIDFIPLVHLLHHTLGSPTSSNPWFTYSVMTLSLNKIQQTIMDPTTELLIVCF